MDNYGKRTFFFFIIRESRENRAESDGIFPGPEHRKIFRFDLRTRTLKRIFIRICSTSGTFNVQQLADIIRVSDYFCPRDNSERVEGPTDYIVGDVNAF